MARKNLVPYCLDFDGTDDYISVPDASSLKGFSQMTIEAWLKRKASNTLNSPILSKYGDYLLHIGLDNKVTGLVFTGNDTNYLNVETGDNVSGGTGWDTTNFIQGTRSYYASKSLGWTAFSVYFNPPSTPYDMSGIASTDYFTIWFYVSDVDSLDSSNAFIWYIRTKAADWNNIYRKTINRSSLRNGWNLLQVRKDAFNVSGGTPDWSQVYNVLITHYPAATGPAVELKYDHLFWTGQKVVESTNALPMTSWKPIALTYDGSNVKLYIDGSLNDTESQTGTVKSGTVELKMGKAYTGNPGKLNAMLGETRIWNKALNADDIAIHAENARDTSADNTSGCTYASNCKLHLPLDQENGSGTTAVDVSGNSNNGSFKGAGEPAWSTATDGIPAERTAASARSAASTRGAASTRSAA